jgi:uncharacterized cupredoxin-like copper-binding protein
VGRKTIFISALVLACAVLIPACSDDDENTDKATLTEYKIELGDGQVKAGEVKFTAENSGGVTHEFVVVRADDAASLPTNADGSVNEDAIPEDDQIGEMEDIEVGAEKSNTFDLEPGHYVVFCNVVTDDDPPVSHFAEGMHAQLTVTP